jgi:uncharacterized protein (TIGR02996 family)
MSPEKLGEWILYILARHETAEVSEDVLRELFPTLDALARWMAPFLEAADLVFWYDRDSRHYHFRHKPLELPMPAWRPDEGLAVWLKAWSEPGDTAAERMVFADWLEERQDPRAEAVRTAEIDRGAVAHAANDLVESSPSRCRPFLAEDLDPEAEAAMRWQNKASLKLYGVNWLQPLEDARKQAQANLRLSIGLMFCPLVDANDRETARRLSKSGIASVDELATGVMEKDGPDVRRKAQQHRSIQALGFEFAPPIGRVRQLWAIEGRLYGDLRFSPGCLLTAESMSACSVEVMGHRKDGKPRVLAVYFLAPDRPRHVNCRSSLLPLKDTGQLRPPPCEHRWVDETSLREADPRRVCMFCGEVRRP